MAKRLDRSDSKSKNSVRFKRTAAPSKYSSFDSRGEEAVRPLPVALFETVKCRFFANARVPFLQV
jgi:hypothetical protein